VIIVKVTMEALMEKRTEMMQTLLSIIEPSAREKGCLSYDIFCDLEDNYVFSLIEEWETESIPFLVEIL
jgi:quinol monooxygenase YgiN